MGKKIYIIVLNWNGYNDTVECIESVKKIHYPDYKLIIVDNGSEDESEEKLRALYPELKLIQTGMNLGFTGGNNAGISYALDQAADFVVLLNNDTIVDKNFIDELVNASEANPDGGIFSSKMYFYDRPDVLWFAGATYSTITGWSKHIGYNEHDTGQYDHVTPIDRACGCAMMVSKEVCTTVGLMNTDYFCYAEETDWCLRAQQKGFKVYFVPDSKIWHKVSVSTGGSASANFLYYAVRNNLKCLHENVPYNNRLKTIARDITLLLLFTGALFSLKLPKLTGFKKIFQGAKDYYCGKTGK